MQVEGRILMGKELSASEAGIVLPPGLLQPFLLRFRREDLHIMAFFGGHPDYEAVEAMIRYRDDGTPSIRAILTRHDQSQVDHVNDDDLSVDGHGVIRQTCRRDIALAVEALPGRRASFCLMTWYSPSCCDFGAKTCTSWRSSAAIPTMRRWRP